MKGYNWDKRLKRAHAQLNRKAKPSTGIPVSIWEWFAMGATPTIRKGYSLREWIDAFRERRKHKWVDAE